MDWNELLHWTEYSKLLVGLLALVDPVTCVPVFATLTRRNALAERRRIALVTSAVLAGTLLVFTFLGEELLALFGVTVDAFRIAGGILLLYLGLEMMGARAPVASVEDGDGLSKVTVAIVPLAIPLLAGPGAISAVIVSTHQAPSLAHDLMVTLVVLTVAALTLALFWLTPLLVRPLSHQRGLAVFDRIMGLIVLAIAVEFIVDGLGAHFPGLYGPGGPTH